MSLTLKKNTLYILHLKNHYKIKILQHKKQHGLNISQYNVLNVFKPLVHPKVFYIL